MRTDVADAATESRLRRIRAPASLFLAALLDVVGQPVLRILHLHHANVTKQRLAHHLARLPHHGVAGVVVCHREQQVVLQRERMQPLRIL